MKTQRSQELFRRAVALMPGGVNSPVRAFKSVGGEPLFIREARGSHVIDADGNDYLDYVGSWGPMILGHAHPQVVAAVQAAVTRGTSYGAPTELEVRLAERITQAVPSIERVRLVSSGTEAVMSAVRLARAFTGRSKVLKFEGCYHGHADGFLSKAGSGIATLGIPDTPGVPAEYAALTLTARFNDLEEVEAAFQAHGGDLAGVVVEPIAGNMGVVPPAPGFLEALRRLTQQHGALLLFDEVITGFRVAFGGAQSLTGVRPDLTTLGKIIGGGFPLAAYGGRAEIMQKVAPEGPVYQAGTLSGNPVAVTAGLTTLEILQESNPYPELERRAGRLEAGLREAAVTAGCPLTVNRVGSMLTAFCTGDPVTDYAAARRSNTEQYGRFFRSMLDRGVYLAPSQFEAAFLSTAHTDAEIDATIAAAAEALRTAT
jgi:glutamate-1-semialdehyde 2,1-aminomutase